jgi:hypothetical protein
MTSASTATATADSPPLCQRTEDMKQLDKKRVRLVGIYRKYLEPTQMPRPGRPLPPPEFLGRAYIEVQGLATAYDPHKAEGTPGQVQLGETARPPTEVTDLEGKKVEVSGLLLLQPVVDNTVARPDPLPRLQDVGAIALHEPR